MVECQLPKLNVAGSTPVSRSTIASTFVTGSPARTIMSTKLPVDIIQTLRKHGDKVSLAMS